MNIPAEAVAIRLYRISHDDLIACEAVQFQRGANAISTVLRRARLSGNVEIGGNIAHHFADLLDLNGDMISTVSLDRKSYAALKNRWMRCKLQTPAKIS